MMRKRVWLLCTVMILTCICINTVFAETDTFYYQHTNEGLEAAFEDETVNRLRQFYDRKYFEFVCGEEGTEYQPEKVSYDFDRMFCVYKWTPDLVEGFFASEDKARFLAENVEVEDYYLPCLYDGEETPYMERFYFDEGMNKYMIGTSNEERETVLIYRDIERLKQKLQQENLGDYQPLQVCSMDSFWYVLAEKDNAYYAIYMPWRHNNYYWESEYYTDFIAKYGDLLKGRVMPADKAVEMMRVLRKTQNDVIAWQQVNPDKVVENTSTGETTEETESTPVRTAWLWVAAVCGAAAITAVIIVLVKSKKRAKL